MESCISIPAAPVPARRFKWPVSVGRLSIEGGEVSAELVTLDV